MTAQRFSRRWVLVAAGAAGLVGLGAVEAPVATAGVDPVALRGRLLGPTRPHVGLVEATGRLGLPAISRLESVTALLTGSTRIRAFVAGPDRWRVDELTPVGERDTFRLGDTEYVWDFGSDQLTRVVGAGPVQLPRPADLLPPTLARRLLARSGADPVTTLPARRIAGRPAAGLRLRPTDPDTTIGLVDVWADPTTGLALRVEVSARTGPPLLLSAYVDLDDRAPATGDLVPTVPPGAGAVTAVSDDVATALRVLGAPPAPDRLAGRDRVGGDRLPGDQLPGVGLYGTGLAGFALIPVSRDIAERAIDGAAAAAGVAVPVPTGRAARVATPLVSLAVRTRRRTGSLLIGTVAPDVLDRAVQELPVRRPM